MKVRKKDRKQFPRIFSPMSLDTSFCSYNAFHWTRNSYTSANDMTDKKLSQWSREWIALQRYYNFAPLSPNWNKIHDEEQNNFLSLYLFYQKLRQNPNC